MKLFTIDKNNWQDGIAKLRSHFRLYGPHKADHRCEFKRLSENELPDLGYGNSRLSPKQILYPQSEVILECTLDQTQAEHHIMKPPAGGDQPRLVLGIRPCDAKAVTLLNLNFDTPEYQDPYWRHRLAQTTLIGLACDQPKSTCFCTSVGCGPYNAEGLDVLLADAGDHYLANVLTEKGETAMTAAGWRTESDAAKAFEDAKTAAEKRIRSSVETDRLKDADIMALHAAPFWEDLAFACINCGTCTYICPTCWCFDLQDEVHGQNACRLKNWDSCMFPLFTLHTSGHNPRDTKLKRMRQRFMHKLKYFVDKYDAGMMCVGCGRCVNHCPVNIDIRRVCEQMNNHAAEAASQTEA